MKQTNLLSQINTRKILANSSSKKNFSAKNTTPYSQILQESISDSSRQNSRNINNSYKQSSNQNTSKYVAVNVLRGDANNDGRVDRKDIDLIVQRMCDDIEGKSDKTKINMMNSDYDNDGVITLDDFSVAVENLTKQEKITVDVLHGDANDDGRVDEKDKELVLNRFFADMEGKGHTVKVNMRNVDFSGDGKITLEDFSRFMEIYNEQQKQSKTILKGDVNGDGKITQADAKTLENFYVGNTDDIVTSNADMNDDGKISLSDLVKVQELADELDPKVLKGDANGDGKVNARDVRLIDRYILEYIDESQIDVKAADMNDNGKITLSDRFMLNQIISEQESKLQTLKGDSNGDGVVDETDYKNIKDYFSGKDSSEDFIMKNADINGDKEIDKKDLQGVRNILDGRKIDWDESKRLLGDVNGDGKIDVVNDAMTIINYLNGEIQKKDFYWDNADVNHDGKIDSEDASRIVKFFNHEIPTLDYEAPSEPSILGDVNGDGVVDVVNDAVLLNRYIKGEDIGNQTIHLNVADVNKDGMINEDDVHGIENIFNGRRIDWKPDPVPPDPDPIPDPVIEVAPPFTNGEVKFKAEVFGDLTLTWKVNADEKVFAGETVRVTGMRSDGKALKIVYSSVYGGTKERWVSADAIEEVTIDPIEETVIKRIEDYMYGLHTNYWKINTKWTGGGECRGFAQQLYSKLFGVGHITGYGDRNYTAANFPGSHEVGRLFDFDRYDLEGVKNLFANAKPGAFVQMGRRNSTNKAGTAPRPHSAIVHHVDSDGVWFYEANAGGTGMITYKQYTWDDLARSNKGFTIYLPNNYA